MPTLTGRELDAEVARVVFGYEVIWRQRMKWSDSHPTITDPVLRIDDSGTGRYRWQPILEYSANMSDAWLVVERMDERGYYLQMRTVQRDGDEHRVTVCEKGTHTVCAIVDADTMFKAICQAAFFTLKATGDDTPQAD